MDFSSLTSLLLIAGAVLWVVSFIPAWVKRGQGVEQVREARIQVNRQVQQLLPKKSKQTNTAHQLIRIGNLRRVTGGITLAGLFVAIFALTDFTHLALLVGFSFGVAAVAVVFNRSLSRRQQKLLLQSIDGRKQATNWSRATYRSTLDAVVSVEPAEDRSWTPRELPAPMHAGHTGSLEQPVLATVTEIPQRTVDANAPEQTFGGASLDEILRRRRAN